MVQNTHIEREAFKKRLQIALDRIPGCPESRGRPGWLKEKMPGDITTKATGKWLAGDSMPTRENMAHLARVLGVAKAWLSEGEGEMEPNGNPEHSRLRSESHQLLDEVPEEYLETVKKMLLGLTPGSD